MPIAAVGGIIVGVILAIILILVTLQHFNYFSAMKAKYVIPFIDKDISEQAQKQAQLTSEFQRLQEQEQQEPDSEKRKQYKKKIQAIKLQSDQIKARKKQRLKEKRIIEEKSKQYDNANEKIEQNQQQLNKKIEEQKQHLKTTKDVQSYRESRERSFIEYLDNVQKILPKKQSQKNQQRNVVLLGKSSVGKSSLLNKILGLELQTGIGETTYRKQSVIQLNDGKFNIWDCPEINDEEYNITEFDNLRFFAESDFVFLLYDVSVKNIKELCLAVWKFRPENAILVRTKSDLWKQSDKKTIQQQIETDYSHLEKWGIKLKIIATSAYKPLTFKDNARFEQLMLGGCKIQVDECMQRREVSEQ